MPKDFYEKTVEDIIFENKNIIHNYGLPKFRKTTFRQFVLPSGKKLDLFSYDLIDGHAFIDIYELKRYDINTDAVCQAYNYFTEVSQLVAGRFRSVDINIVMVGRTYVPFMLFEKMNLPFSVYTYDYKLSGMMFTKHQERKFLKQPDDDFCYAMWGFGQEKLVYPDGQPDTVNIASAYSAWKKSNKEAHEALAANTGSLFATPIVKEIETIRTEYVYPKGVKTEIFPVQPSWTSSFAKEIPDDEYMFDLQDDKSDYEEDPIENDLSDLEVEHEGFNLILAETPAFEDEGLKTADQLNNETYYSHTVDLAIVPKDCPELKKAEEFINKILKTA